MKKLQSIFRAMANRRRMEIVRMLLARKEMSVGAIARVLKLSLPAISRHLYALTQADFLESRQEGLTIFYRIANNPDTRVRTILKLLA